MYLFIPQNIKYLLDKEKIDHATFGEEIGVSRAMISHYSTGKSGPKIETLHKIANYFNITLDQLVLHDLQKDSYVKEMVSEPTAVYKTELHSTKDLVKQLQDHITSQDEVIKAQRGIIKDLKDLHKERSNYEQNEHARLVKEIERLTGLMGGA